MKVIARYKETNCISHLGCLISNKGHELTHVVQQRAGRVKPDAKQGKGGMNINSDKSLENEADVMGAKAAQGKDASMVSGKGSGVQRKEERKPTNFRTDLRSLNNKIENQFDEALAYFDRVLNLKSEKTDYDHKKFLQLLEEAIEPSHG